MRNSPVNTTVSEGGGGGAPGARVEIPLQPMETPQWSRYFPAAPREDHAGTGIHNAELWRTPCQSSWIFPEGPVAHEEPRLEQIFTDGLQPTKGLMLEEGKGVRKKEQQTETAMS